LMRGYVTAMKATGNSIAQGKHGVRRDGTGTTESSARMWGCLE